MVIQPHPHKSRAHGRLHPRSVSKCAGCLDQYPRGRSYREALILLEFMPYRSTGPIHQGAALSSGQAENNLALTPPSLINQARDRRHGTLPD